MAPTYAGGGSFTPESDLNFTGQVNFAQTPTFGPSGTTQIVTTTGTQTLTNKTLTAPVLTGATVISSGTLTGATTIGTGATITGAALVGATTIASGAVLTTPTVRWNTQEVTATGATAGAGAAISAVTPGTVTATGVSGAGIDLPAAVTGAFIMIVNKMTGVLKIYSSGSTINGTTGTTAYNVTATGNLTAFATCSTTAAWSVSGNT